MIEAPSKEDIEKMARIIVHANKTALNILNVELDGSKNDLALIQKILDSGQIDSEDWRTLQALGLAFGKVFVGAETDYDWWIVNDEYGRDPAVRYRRSSLTFHPMTMISKRVEEGDLVNVIDLYEGLRSQLLEVIEGGVDGA